MHESSAAEKIYLRAKPAPSRVLLLHVLAKLGSHIWGHTDVPLTCLTSLMHHLLTMCNIILLQLMFSLGRLCMAVGMSAVLYVTSQSHGMQAARLC